MRNDYAFSFSGWKTFRKCPRAWWLSKVLFWEGWLKSAPQRTRLAYGLTKMQTLYTLAGRIVHTLAEGIIRRPERADAELLMREFTREFDAGLAESKSGAWAGDPKRITNLYEDYYRLPEAEREQIEERARAAGLQSAMNLASSAAVTRAAAVHAGGRVISTERLEQFQVAGIPVWVSLDLAFRDDGGTVYLTDYKTGRPRAEHRAQIGLYALFWQAKETTPMENLRLSLEYLRDGTEELIAPNEDELDEIRAGIIEAASTQIEKLAPAQNGVLFNAGREEDFPGRDDEVCLSCHLFHVCKGTRAVPFERTDAAVAAALIEPKEEAA